MFSEYRWPFSNPTSPKDEHKSLFNFFFLDQIKLTIHVNVKRYTVKRKLKNVMKY